MKKMIYEDAIGNQFIIDETELIFTEQFDDLISMSTSIEGNLTDELSEVWDHFVERRGGYV